jgi:ankyrin repeat protein
MTPGAPSPNNNLKVAEILLKHGADVNAQDNQGWTALHFAAQNYSEEAIKMLLANNCEVDVKDMHGNTPLFRAVFNSKGRGEVIQLLICHGADKNLKNNHGMSPSDLASTIANYNITQYM